MMGDLVKVNLQICCGGIIVSYMDWCMMFNMWLVGIDDNFMLFFNFEIVCGWNFDFEDVVLGRLVCIFGEEVVKKFFFDIDFLGQVVWVGGQIYMVVGMVVLKGMLFGESQDDFIVILIMCWLVVMGGVWCFILINVQVLLQEFLFVV